MNWKHCFCGFPAAGPALVASDGTRWRIVCWAHGAFASWPIAAKMHIGFALDEVGADWLRDRRGGKVFAAEFGTIVLDDDDGARPN